MHVRLHAWKCLLMAPLTRMSMRMSTHLSANTRLYMCRKGIKQAFGKKRGAAFALFSFVFACFTFFNFEGKTYDDQERCCTCKPKEIKKVCVHIRLQVICNHRCGLSLFEPLQSPDIA